MDFDSLDVMKDFPGLYGAESNKKCKDDSDFSDDATKNDSLIGKKKDKKDKKDKEKGYAALEGESSGDENSKSRSPSKYKKAKSFKFTSKSKERRDKSKEKDVVDKKNKDKKLEKKVEKEKGKLDKLKKVKIGEENCNLADALPIFGVSLETAVARSKCHDGVDIPLPVRQCIDYLEVAGMSFEGIYKVSGTKSKVVQIRKMFNNRENVNLYDYDVPTSTSLLKMFLRDLPESLFTNDSLVRFEEAGAILSSGTREKHLRILLDNLPQSNKLLLSWLLIHLDNVSQNERVNKMSRSNLGASLNHTFHVSSRLLTALIQHSRALFPQVTLTTYVPPLSAGAVLPVTAESIDQELKKQESLLAQIHMEMHSGCIVKQREELLWEVQRIITQLKRKMKSFQKDKEVVPQQSMDKASVVPEEKTSEAPLEGSVEKETSFSSDLKIPDDWPPTTPEIVDTSSKKSESSAPQLSKVDSKLEKDSNFEKQAPSDLEFGGKMDDYEKLEEVEPDEFFELQDSGNFTNIDKAISLMKIKNTYLLQLRENLIKAIHLEHKEIDNLTGQLKNKKIVLPVVQHSGNLDKIMDLLHKENQILQIKKINLVRQIIEQQEICIDYRAKIELYSSLQK